MIGLLLTAVLLAGAGLVWLVPPAVPIIQNIDANKIYNAPIRLQVKKQMGVQYQIIVDGEVYLPDTLYDRNGKHTVKAVAKRGWATAVSASIPFELDTAPPALPVISGVKANQIYSGEVAVYFQPQPGVQLQSIIDEKPYVPGTPYGEQGGHVLRVKAVKERNGLTAERDIPFIIDHTRYTEDEIAYLEEIAFASEYGSSYDRVKKWNTDLRIGVRGHPDAAELQALEQVMQDANRLMEGVKMVREDENPNVVMYFIPHKDFVKYTSKELAKANWGLVTFQDGSEGVIQSAQVLIATDKGTPASRAHLIREELTQGLGMAQDSWKYEDSVFYQGWTETMQYAPIDKKIISMLYRSDILPGMEKQQVLELLKANLSDRVDRLQVFPLDESVQDGSLAAFRDQLLEIVEKKDTVALLQVISPHFHIAGESQTGKEIFKLYWNIAANDALQNDESPVWDVLAKSLLMGGILAGDNKFEAPYAAVRFPPGYSKKDTVLVIGSDVSVYRQPSVTSPIQKQLSYDLVESRLYQPEEQQKLDRLMENRSLAWMPVLLLDGTQGYICVESIYSTNDPVLVFAKDGQEWKLVEMRYQ